MPNPYGYFPGCSLKGTGVAYEESLLALFQLLDLPLAELDDWNCCGATSYMCIDECSAFFAGGAKPRLGAQSRASGTPGPVQRLLPGLAQDTGLRRAIPGHRGA